MKKLLALPLLALGFSTLSISSPVFADDLLATIAADSSFKTFQTAVQSSSLAETLKGPGPFTLFVPNDAAFAKIPKAKLKALLADKEKLNKLLAYHVLNGKITKADVDAGKVKTAEGSDLTLSITDGVKVNNVAVKGQEIDADNGVIHIVDTVLMPKK